jgi:hypothetical protein
MSERNLPVINDQPHPGSVVASALAGQLGSDDQYIGDGRADMRRLTVLEEKHIGGLIGLKTLSLLYPDYKMIYDEILNLRVSIGGRGRRDIIRMEQVSHGGGVDVTAELEAMKPNWLGRMLHPDWKKKAMEQGPP